MGKLRHRARKRAARLSPSASEGALPSVCPRAGPNPPHVLCHLVNEEELQAQRGARPSPGPSTAPAASLGGEAGAPGPTQGRRLQGGHGEEGGASLWRRLLSPASIVSLLLSKPADAAIAVSPHFPDEETEARLARGAAGLRPDPRPLLGLWSCYSGSSGMTKECGQGGRAWAFCPRWLLP